MSVAGLVTSGVWCWVSLRLTLMSSFMLAAGCAVCILCRGSIDAIKLSLMLQYLLTLQGDCIYLLVFYGEMERKMVSVQRLLDFNGIKQEAADQPSFQPQGQELVGDWPSSGRVVFKDVYMRYRPSSPLVLRGLSFEVPARAKIGVVGRTGAGKSTLLMTMSRIVELERGQILIDDKDISRHDLQELRSKITVIEQDPSLFTGTLRFNLDPFN